MMSAHTRQYRSQTCSSCQAKEVRRLDGVQMAQKPESTGETAPRISMEAPHLWSLEFQRSTGAVDPKSLSDLPIQLSFSLNRIAGEKLGVEFIVETPRTEGLGLSFRIAYRAVFTFEGELPPDFDPDREFQHVVGHVATSALYPYVRQTIHSTASRAGIERFVLPVVNFRDLIDPSTLEIPKVTSNVGEPGTDAIG
jgi:preprotein translocase subunit SecB